MVFLVSLTAGTFFVWTTALFWSPWEPPRVVRPAVVAAIAAGLSMTPPRPLEVLAAAGVVGLVHHLVER